MKATVFVATGMLALAADALQPPSRAPVIPCGAEDRVMIDLNRIAIETNDSTILQPIGPDGVPIIDISAGLAGLTPVYRS
jgi:hypothetical protein